MDKILTLKCRHHFELTKLSGFFGLFTHVQSNGANDQGRV